MSRAAAAAVIAAGGLALALGLGLPDPGLAERAFAGFMGFLACMLAVRWLRSVSRMPAAPTSSPGDGATGDVPRAPAAEATEALARALGLGVSTIGSYHLLVRPRLQALAGAKLARLGPGLEDASEAQSLLGDGWVLVDPATPAPADGVAPGIPIVRLEELVATLERMP
jgi:hypothetical protein